METLNRSCVHDTDVIILEPVATNTAWQSIRETETIKTLFQILLSTTVIKPSDWTLVKINKFLILVLNLLMQFLWHFKNVKMTKNKLWRFITDSESLLKHPHSHLWFTVREGMTSDLQKPAESLRVKSIVFASTGSRIESRTLVWPWVLWTGEQFYACLSALPPDE